MASRTGIRNLRRDRRGVVVPLVALFIMSLLGFAGLTIDVGHWYDTQAKLQNCADAAAMAGCTALPDATAASAKAREYCGKNGVLDSEVITIRPLPEGSANPNRFEVLLRRRAGPFFTAIYGFQTVQISARSVAEASAFVTVTPGTGSEPSALDYAIYAGREFTSKGKVDESAFAGTNMDVYGKLHTNGDLKLTGNNNTFHDPVTTGHTVKAGGGSGNTFEDGYTENAPKVSMPEIDTSSVIQKAKEAGTYYKYDSASGQILQWVGGAGGGFVAATPPAGANFSGNKLQFPGSTDVINGTYYLEGLDLHFSGSSAVCNATFVATGDIKVAGTGIHYAAQSKLAFVSLSESQQAFDISGSNSEYNGYFYAPNGTIKFSGSDLRINGGVAANNYVQNISGQNIDIYYSKDQANQVPIKSQTTVFIRLVE